jgi:cytochrome P450
MLERGHGELVGEFSSVIPLVIIFELLGYPREDVEALKPLLYAVQLRTPGATEPPETAVQARGQLHAYIEAAAEERRKNPRDDLLTHIVESEKSGGVTREEIPGMAVLLMIAGWETSSILITNAIWLLAQHPEQRERLRQNPHEIPTAVEEVLRFDGPVQHLARLTLKDATLRDQTIPAGNRVLLLWASANRDERRWEDPDRFDITRELKRNLAFGEGIHHCLGAPLARLESRVVLEALLARDVEFEVGEPGRLPQVIIRGISELPIRFG